VSGPRHDRSEQLSEKETLMPPRNVDQVVSGVPYVVTSVNDRTPTSLEEFVEHDVVAITAAHLDQVITIRGSARHQDDSVVLHEKDSAGVGKDVRTWRISDVNGRFEAVERSIY
jgi:hypothetical protein